MLRRMLGLRPRDPDAGAPERAPLLAAASRRAATPLPTKQIFVLCLMRFAEPISFSLLYPFVNHVSSALSADRTTQRRSFGIDGD